MWQFHYLQARQIAQDRVSEANRDRLARDARPSPLARRSRLDDVRRRGAVVAAGIARRLDERVAREELGLSGAEEAQGSPG